MMSQTGPRQVVAPRRRGDTPLQRARLLLLRTELDLLHEATAGRPPTPGQVSRARWFEGECARLEAALRPREAPLRAVA